LTDGQTDSFLIAIPRLHSMQRGKKLGSAGKSAGNMPAEIQPKKIWLAEN